MKFIVEIRLFREWVGLGILQAVARFLHRTSVLFSSDNALTEDGRTDRQGAMSNVTSKYFSSDLLSVKVDEVLQNENKIILVLCTSLASSQTDKTISWKLPVQMRTAVSP